ncbi:MAG: Glu/Leu/Phe/Val dehydrogenase, partial [Deltaproteobacteria bacterium]|nr:Glu/Leu/Phe/Val dehydrogenase [Deltaproteobacteria bacterium]
MIKVLENLSTITEVRLSRAFHDVYIPGVDNIEAYPHVMRKFSEERNTYKKPDVRQQGAVSIATLGLVVLFVSFLAALFHYFASIGKSGPLLKVIVGLSVFVILFLILRSFLTGFFKNSTLLDDTKAKVRRIAKIISLDKKLLDLLWSKNNAKGSVITVQFPVPKDNGDIMHLTGFCAMYDTGRGAFKGGIRFHPEVTREEVMGLSFLMAIKCAIAGIPFSGGKSGVRVDPEKLSRTELARVTRGFCRALLEYGEEHGIEVVGPYSYIPATDVGTDQAVAAWFADEYLRFMHEKQAIADERLKAALSVHLSGLQSEGMDIYGDVTGTPCLDKVSSLAEQDLTLDTEELAVITNKPVDKRGCRGRLEATGLGVFLTAKELASRLLKEDLAQCSVAVQGYGNVGLWTARFCYQYGAKVLAVSNRYSALHNPEGIDINALDKFIKEKQQSLNTKKEVSFKGFTGAKFMDEDHKDELLYLDVDVMMNCALEKQYTGRNARRARFKLQVPGANGVNTPLASAIFAKAGRKEAFDGISNALGVVESYFEWLQNLNNEQWKKTSVYKMGEERMVTSLRQTMKIYDTYRNAGKPVTLSDASMILGITRIIDSMLAQDRGLAASFRGKRKPYKIPLALKSPETIEELNLAIEQGGINDIVTQAEKEHQNGIGAIASGIIEAIQKQDLPQKRGNIVFVAGPLSAGKVVFAERLTQELAKQNVAVKTFHIDEGGGESALRRLLDGRTVKLNYPSWTKRFVKDSQSLRLESDTILVVEGDRKFTEQTYLKLTSEGRKVLVRFVNTATSMKMKDNYPLTSRDLRLMRRILEFCQRRTERVESFGRHVSSDILGQTALNIVKMRDSIRQAQMNKAYNLWQYAEESRVSTFNAYLPYELVAYKPILWPVLQRAFESAVERKDSRSIRIIANLQSLLGQVRSVEDKVIPQDSILTEFVSKDRIASSTTAARQGGPAVQMPEPDTQLHSHRNREIEETAIAGELLQFENGWGVWIMGEHGAGKSFLARKFVENDRRWKVVSCGSTRISLGDDDGKRFLLGKRISASNILFSRLLGSAPVTLSPQALLPIRWIIAVDDSSDDFLENILGSGLRANDISVRVIKVDDLDISRQWQEILKRINDIIESESDERKTKFAKLAYALFQRYSETFTSRKGNKYRLQVSWAPIQTSFLESRTVAGQVNTDKLITLELIDVANGTVAATLSLVEVNYNRIRTAHGYVEPQYRGEGLFSILGELTGFAAPQGLELEAAVANIETILSFLGSPSVQGWIRVSLSEQRRDEVGNVVAKAKRILEKHKIIGYKLNIDGIEEAPDETELTYRELQILEETLVEALGEGVTIGQKRIKNSLIARTFAHGGFEDFTLSGEKTARTDCDDTFAFAKLVAKKSGIDKAAPLSGEKPRSRGLLSVEWLDEFVGEKVRGALAFARLRVGRVRANLNLLSAIRYPLYAINEWLRQVLEGYLFRGWSRMQYLFGEMLRDADISASGPSP